MQSATNNAVLPDYKDDAEAYEIEERSRPDEMLMLQTAGMLASKILDSLPRATVIDFCCGTGLSLEYIVNHPNLHKVVGLDISEQYLAFVKQKYSNSLPKPQFIMGDAVNAPLPLESFDLIMMASAYHHIEDQRKVEFLKRVRNLLSPRGYGVMAENILPPYPQDDVEAYREATSFFYREVLKTAEIENPALEPYVRQLIQKVAEYGCDGDYEYKVNYNIFKNHLSEAGLTVVEESRVWPLSGPLSETSGGNYVLLVKAI